MLYDKLSGNATSIANLHRTRPIWIAVSDSAMDVDCLRVGPLGIVTQGSNAFEPLMTLSKKVMTMDARIMARTRKPQ